jgi:hypothetical protein
MAALKPASAAAKERYVALQTEENVAQGDKK